MLKPFLALSFLLSPLAMAQPKLIDPLGPLPSRRWHEPVRVIHTNLAPDDADATGTWTLNVADLVDHPLAITLEVAPTPECPDNAAVFFAAGGDQGLVPSSVRGGLGFAISLLGKIYFVDLTPDGPDALKGMLTAFDDDTKHYPATGRRTGRVADVFTIKPVVASVNGVPTEVTEQDGTKVWYVRAPDASGMAGDVVFHNDLAQQFACFGIPGKSGKAGALAFSYSDDPILLVVKSDLARPQDQRMWYLTQGAWRLQKGPFVVSVTATDGHSIDLVGRE